MLLIQSKLEETELYDVVNTSLFFSIKVIKCKTS